MVRCIATAKIKWSFRAHIPYIDMRTASGIYRYRCPWDLSGMRFSEGTDIKGRLLSMGMMPIIFARRMALPSRRCDFQVRFVCARDRILPMSVTKCESSVELVASSRGLMPSW